MSSLATPIEDLYLQGFALVGRLSQNQIQETNAYLLGRPVYADAHVPQTARNADRTLMPREQAAASECLCVHTEDAILAPHLLEFALSHTPVAADYLAADPPILYSANAFWTRPGSEPLRGDTQELHRDQDDARFLALFIYLTDVLDPADGPHEIEGPDFKVRPVYGRAGTAFFSDTSHRHRGGKPQRTERGIIWFRWGVSPLPAAYVWDQLSPVVAARLGARYPADPYLRASMRLMAA